MDAVSGKSFPSINPSTGEVICEVAEGDKVIIINSSSILYSSFIYTVSLRQSIKRGGNLGTLLNSYLICYSIISYRDWLKQQHTMVNISFQTLYYI